MASSKKTSAALPPRWPKDRQIALSVNVMLEGWTADSAPSVGPMGNILGAGIADTQARSWAEYGPKAGAPRLLEILGAANIRSVFYVSGIIAEKYPELIADIRSAGHTIAAHGWAQNIIPASQSEEQETRDLKNCIAVLERFGGRAQGWLSPRCTPSARTSALLAGAGFDWHADSFDADLPYTIETQRGTIIGMPFTMEVNDMPLYIRYGNEPEAFTRVLEKILAGAARLKTPFCLDITAHAHVFGRPSGAIAFAEALNAAVQHPKAWLTNHAELADVFGPLAKRLS